MMPLVFLPATGESTAVTQASPVLQHTACIVYAGLDFT